MNPELIKQAYAYGAAVALHELGFSSQQAQNGGVKLAEAKLAEGEEGMEGMGGAEEAGGMSPALLALLGTGAGALGVGALGAGSAFIPGMRNPAVLQQLLKRSPGLSKLIPSALTKRNIAGQARNVMTGTRGGNLEEAYLRGLGGAGAGALGGGISGGLMAGE